MTQLAEGSATQSAVALEIKKLRRSMNDLITLTALPSIWNGGDVTLIGNTLLDAVDAIMNVDFLYLRLPSPQGNADLEFARLPGVNNFSDAGRFGEYLYSVFDSAPPHWPRFATLQLESKSYSTVLVQLGHSHAGILVAGTKSASFPTQQDTLILNIAANQVAMATSEAVRFLEQRNIAAELDRRVVERTAELDALNVALRKEIAERRQTEEALRNSELTSRLIVDSMSGLVAVLSPDGRVEAANNQLKEYCGIEPEEFGQWDKNKFVHQDDTRLALQLNNAGRLSGPFDYEARLRRHDGVYRWFQIRGVPFRTVPDSVARWYVFLTDIDDRKRVEAARLAAAQELENVINAIPVMAWATLPDGTADFFNGHFLSFLGFTAEQAYGWGWAAAVHPDDLESLKTVWLSLIRSGLSGEAEARLRRADGEYKWFLFRTNPVYAEDGSIARWYGTNTDIDDRKRAEEELRRSAAFLTQGQRLTATGSVWWKPSTRDMFWSEEAYRIAGYPETQKPSLELMLGRCHPDDLPRVRELVEHAAQLGANVDMEHRLLMPDRSIKYVHVVLQNIGKETAEPEFIGAVTDVTARMVAEERVQRSDLLLAEGQRISQTGTFSWQVDTDELSFSSEMNRIFGFKDGTVIDFDLIAGRVYEEDLPLLAVKMADVRSGGDNPDYEIRLQVDGSIKHVRVVGRIVRHLDGSTECIGAVQDVTAQRVAEAARDKLRSELTQIARVMSLSTMAAAIAHEVNQPLSGVITNASTALRMLSATPPNIEGALETARRTIRDGNRAADVVTRLKTLFLRGISTIELFDLNNAAREVIALFANDIQRERISLRAELSEALPFIGADRVQVQQVIMNLIRNSIDAMAEISQGARDILVRTAVGSDEEVLLTVEDTGPGIASADIAWLFDPFHTTKAKGMGIGLSVSRSIVEAHGGKIWAISNPAGGATFGFSIPYRSVNAQPRCD